MNDYDDAWDWIDVEIEDWGSFLDEEELDEYIRSQFPHIGDDNEGFWGYVEDSIRGYYDR